MIEVIPAILVKEFTELEEEIRKVEPFVKWVQIDVSDGNFTPNVTWNNPKDLEGLDTSIFIEVHLMISEPEKNINNWIAFGIKRVIVHIEAIKENLIEDISKECHHKGIEFGIALNPETSIAVITNFVSYVDLVLFLAVSPGFGGRKFSKEVLLKITAFRKKYPDVKIEVDGGINQETGKECIEAGADILVAGSYVFGSKDIKKAIEKLQNLN